MATTGAIMSTAASSVCQNCSMGSDHDFDHGVASQPPWDRPLTRRDLLRYGAALGFGAVGAGMLASCTPVDGGYPQPAAPPEVPSASAKYLVIVIVDGCRADYVDPSLHLPNLQRTMRSGTTYSNAWSGSMESITPACHASIGTGRFAKNNGGILGFYWENPSNHVYGEAVNLANSRTVGQLGNNVAVDPTSLEQILQVNKVPTMASYLKDVDPRAKVYAGAGAKFYAADAAGGPDADFITYVWNDGPNYYRGVNVGGPNHKLLSQKLLNSVGRNDYTWSNYGELDKHGRLILNSQGQPVAPPTAGEVDSMTIDLARKVVEQERPRIVILNLGDEDWPYGHLNGGILSPQYWKPVMKNVDAGVGRLMDTYKKLGIFHETVFMFLGDHGMVPLAQQVDHNAIHNAVYSAGTSFVPNGATGGLGADFHTGGFLWLTDPEQAAKAAEFIDDAIDAGNLRGVLGVYFRAEAAGRQQFLPSPYTSRTLLPASDHAYRYLLETMNGAN